MRPQLPLELHPECACWPYRPEKVQEYKSRIEAGEVPPSGILIGDKILDGAHTFEAWLLAGRDSTLFPWEQLSDGANPGKTVHKRHQGTRQLNVSQMAEQVKRRAEQTGIKLDTCIEEACPDKAYEDLLRLHLKRQEKRPVTRPETRRAYRKSREFTRVIVPDSHGEHIDPAARDAFLSDLSVLDPKEVVMLGDHLDCGGTFSVHQRSYTNEMTESYSQDVEAARAFLDEIQKRAPRAQFHYLEGNHEQHVERWATREFSSHKDAVLAVGYLGPENVLELKKRGIAYYTRSQMYMGCTIPGTIRLGKCFFVHGISHATHAASNHLRGFGDNVVFGHVHRVQSVTERTVTSSGFGAWCPGTLAKLQPLYKHTAPTSWSHGYGLQFVTQHDGTFVHLNVPIVEGRSLLPERLKAA